MILRIEVGGQPRSQPRPSGYIKGRPIYDAKSDAKAKAWREQIQWAARSAMAKQRIGIQAGPVRLVVCVGYERPKSPTYDWPSIGDAKNVGWLVEDALNQIAYIDDRQVCDLRTAKRFRNAGEGPLTIITVEAMEVPSASIIPRVPDQPAARSKRDGGKPFDVKAERKPYGDDFICEDCGYPDTKCQC